MHRFKPRDTTPSRGFAFVWWACILPRMSRLSKYLRSVQGGGLMFWCPGCDSAHMVKVGDGPGPRWGYNGDPERPTFTPSIRVQGTRRPSESEVASILRGEPFEPVKLVCHSFVTDGKIQFLSDCTHDLAAHTVDIPPFPDGDE